MYPSIPMKPLPPEKRSLRSPLPLQRSLPHPPKSLHPQPRNLQHQPLQPRSLHLQPRLKNRPLQQQRSLLLPLKRLLLPLKNLLLRRNLQNKRVNSRLFCSAFFVIFFNRSQGRAPQMKLPGPVEDAGTCE